MIATLELVELRRGGGVLTAAVTAGATVLPLDLTLDYDEAGGLLELGGATYTYTAVGDDFVTLASGILADAEVDTPAWTVDAQGNREETWIAWVDLGDDGDTVPASIPTSLIGYFPEGDAAIGQDVEVEATADGYRVANRPDQAATFDGSLIDPATPIPGGQTFSLDAPSDTTGYPEDYGWWQVDADDKVLGFWRLVGGVWTAQTIVTQEALQVGNILVDALSGETITGTTVQTAASGKRVVLDGADTVPALKAYDATSTQTVNIDGESNYMVGTLATNVDTSPRLILGPHPTLPNVLELRGYSGDSAELGQMTITAGVSGLTPSRYTYLNLQPTMITTGLAPSIRIRGRSPDGVNANEVEILTAKLIATMGDGSVGTGTFRDSVRSVVMGDYAAGAWTAYTPTFIAATTNPTLGNFTRAGRWTQRGKTVTFSVVITATAASGFGTGTYEFGLPVTARNADEVIVTGSQTGPTHTYIGRGETATTFRLSLTSTEVNMNSTNSAMASGTVVRISGTYEAA